MSIKHLVFDNNTYLDFLRNYITYDPPYSPPDMCDIIVRTIQKDLY